MKAIQMNKLVSKFNRINRANQIKVVCDKKIIDRECYLYELNITFTNQLGSISTFIIENNKGAYYLPTNTNNIYEQKFIELFNSKNTDDDDTLDLPFDTEKKEVSELSCNLSERTINAIKIIKKDTRLTIENLKELNTKSDKKSFSKMIESNIKKLAVLESFLEHKNIEFIQDTLIKTGFQYHKQMQSILRVEFFNETLEDKKEVVKAIEKKDLSRIEKLNCIVKKYDIERLERPILAQKFKYILHTGEQGKTFSPLWIVCKFNNKSEEYQKLLLELKELYKNSIVPL